MDASNDKSVKGFKVFNIFDVKSGVYGKVIEPNGQRTFIRVLGGKEDVPYSEDKVPAIDGGCIGVALSKNNEGFFEVSNRSENFGRSKHEMDVASNDFITTVKGFNAISYYPHVRMLLVQFTGYKGMTTTGEVPNFGNLGYINGAMNRLIVAPKKYGEPCLNGLYIDKPIDQTPHTHPSSRTGLVMDGNVTARIYQNHDRLDKYKEVNLVRGDVFIMSENVMHSFHKSDHEKTWLCAFHPDSNFGPTDEVAPMINRTILQDGLSASDVKEIHTIQ